MINVFVAQAVAQYGYICGIVAGVGVGLAAIYAIIVSSMVR